MAKRIPGLIGIILTFVSIISQAHAQRNRDSLNAILRPNVIDSNQWSLHIELSKAFVYANPDSSLYHLEKALSIAKLLGSDYMKAQTLNDFGVTYFYKSEYEKSVDHYFSSLEISRQKGFENQKATTLGNLGMLFSEKGDNENAVSYYRQSYEIKLQLKDSMGVARALNNIGLTFYQMSKLDSAEYYYLQALRMARMLKSRYGEGLILNNLGSIELKRKGFEKARAYYFQAIDVKKEVDDLKGMATAYNNIGQTYLGENEPQKALGYFEKGMEYARMSDHLGYEKDALEGLSKANAALENYAMALDFHLKFKALSDTLLNEINGKQVEELETKYQTQQKQVEIQRLQAANEIAATHRRNLILLFSLGLLLMVGAGAYIFMRIRYKQQQRIAQVEKDRAEELARLNTVTTKFVPTAFLSGIGKKEIIDVRLGDHREKEVTVFFSDIRDFTTLAEKSTPTETFEFIRDYSQMIGPIVSKYRGFVNQYLGDGILALFPESPEDALKAAVMMQKELEIFNQAGKRAGKGMIRVGMGMHTGPLIMGIVGDKERMEPVIVSDTVNTASRVESLTKHFGANILITGNGAPNEEEFDSRIFGRSPHPALKDISGLRYLGKVLTKGKAQPVSIYECFDGDSPMLRDRKYETLHDFNYALARYFAKDFSEAIAMLQQILKVNPGDDVAKFFLRRAKQLKESVIEYEWHGVEVMTEK